MLQAQGKIKGLKIQTRKNSDGEEYKTYFLGIADHVPGGYDGEESITDLKLTKQQIQDGLHTRIDSERGNLVRAPFFLSDNVYNGKNYRTFWLADTWEIIEKSKLQASVKAA